MQNKIKNIKFLFELKYITHIENLGRHKNLCK